MSELTLDSLRGLSPRELEKTVERLDARLLALHQDLDGTVRTKSTTERDEFDDLIELRDAAVKRIKQHAEITRAFERNPGGVQIALQGYAHGSSGYGAASDVEPHEALRMAPEQARDGALRALEHRGAPLLRSEQGDRMDALLRSTISADNPNTDGGYIARRTLITESDAYRSAWRQVITGRHPLLTAEEVDALRSLRQLDYEYRAMSEGTPSAGGYGVPVFIDPTIVMTAQGSLNPFRRICRVETITTNKWKGVSSAGVTWSWDAEGSTVSDDSPTLAQPEVDVFMARGFLPYSIEAGQDYPGFAEEMARLLASGYDELTAQAFATGAGTTEPTGIITALDANTNTEVVVTTDGAFGGVDINKVWGALPDRYKSNATWVMSHDVGNEVATFGNANNLSFVTVDFTNVVSTVRQRPVEFSSYFPDFTGTTGAANILTVGDFSNYLIASRAGMAVEPIPILFDVTSNRPTGERGLFAWARTGGNSINDLAFRLLQNQ
ncbi:MAG: phage major capsid protein [Pseudonocardiaceae bacterium]